jgi:hypothetical protein
VVCVAVVAATPQQVPFAEHIDSPAEVLSGAIMLGGCVVAIVVMLGIVLAAVGGKRWSAAAFLLAIPLGIICARSSFIIIGSGG